RSMMVCSRGASSLAGHSNGEEFPSLSAEEVLPVGHAVVIADERRSRQRTWRSGRLAQAQARLLRQTIGFAAVDLAVGKHAVLPRRFATARTRDDVVDVPLVAIELAAGVLADATGALPDAASAEARAAERDARVVHRHDDGRNTHGTARCVHGL